MEIQERLLSLRGYVDEESTGKIIDKILNYNFEDDKNKIPIERRSPIHLHIQSPGGNTYDGYALVDIILTSKTPVYTYGEGSVESSALDIYMAGKRRYAYEHTMFMVHGNATSLEGKTLPNMKSYLDMVTTLDDWGKDLLSSRSLLSRSQVDDVYNSNKDIFFTVDKAIKCGIVTHLIEWKVGIIFNYIFYYKIY